MDTSVVFADLDTMCETCRIERCSCFCSECWNSERNVICKEHPSVMPCVGGNDAYVIIVSGSKPSHFMKSCRKLRRTLTDVRFLGLSAGNVFVEKASSESAVRMRLLSLKLLLEVRVIDQACSRLLEILSMPPGNDILMRDFIAGVCTRVRDRLADKRFQRRTTFSISQKAVSRNDIFPKDVVFGKCVTLAYERMQNLDIDLTKREDIVTATEKAKKALAMSYLWKYDGAGTHFSEIREKEHKQLTEFLEKPQLINFSHSVDDLGREVDECFRVLISTSCLPVSLKALKVQELGPDEPKIWQQVQGDTKLLRNYIIQSLRPLRKGFLWYYYCGDAAGRGDDGLDDNVLPKVLLEATGRLVANMIVTLDCSHADANLPSIVHFVGDDTAQSNYTALTSCTARQKAKHGTSQAFTEFLICGLRGAVDDCRSVFHRCFGGNECSNSYCDTCSIFKSVNKGQCEICNIFSSSTKKFHALDDVFAYVKAHLCPNRMHPLMRRSRPEKILPIAKVYQNDSRGKVYKPKIPLPEKVKDRIISGMLQLSKINIQQLDISPEVPNIASECTNAHVIIVCGAGKSSKVFQQCSLELQETLSAPQFVGIRNENVSVFKEGFEKKLPLRLLSLLLHLEEKVMNVAASRASAILGKPSDDSNIWYQKIVHVCTLVRKRLAQRRCQRTKLTPGLRSHDSEWFTTILFRLACKRMEQLKKVWSSKEQSNVGYDGGKPVSASERAEHILALFDLWDSYGRENWKVVFRLYEKTTLQDLANHVSKYSKFEISLRVLGMKVDKCFRELVLAPFLPVSMEAINENDLNSDDISGYKKSQIYEVIVDSLRPLNDELLWYHYCGHATGGGDDVLDDKVLPKALLEATGRLVSNMIVTLDCCHAEANIPDIPHFMDDLLCSSFSVLASCAARQKSIYTPRPAFTQFFIYGLKNAIDNCRHVDFVKCKKLNCCACKYRKETNNECETCSKFQSSAKLFHSLADIFHFVKAHLCSEIMYPVMRQSANNYSPRVARAHLKTSTCESVADEQREIQKPRSKTVTNVLQLLQIVTEEFITLLYVRDITPGLLTEDEREIHVVGKIKFRDCMEWMFFCYLRQLGRDLGCKTVRCYIDAIVDRRIELDFMAEVKLLLTKAGITDQDTARWLIDAVLVAFWNSLRS